MSDEQVQLMVALNQYLYFASIGCSKQSIFSLLCTFTLSVELELHFITAEQFTFLR